MPSHIDHKTHLFDDLLKDVSVYSTKTRWFSKISNQIGLFGETIKNRA